MRSAKSYVPADGITAASPPHTGISALPYCKLSITILLSRRKFFVLADVTAKARGKLAVIAPLALEAVKRIDAIFNAEREINGRSASAGSRARRSR
jgi:hypothetical protein